MKPRDPYDSPPKKSVQAACQSPFEWATAAGAVHEVLTAVNLRLKSQRRRRARSAIAGSLLLVSLGLCWSRLRPEGGEAVPAAATFRWVASPRRQILSDGSIVELRGNARVKIDYSPMTRGVVLEQGEALFQVAKNPLRPFVVTAGTVQFRAVGTAFSVVLAPQRVEMLVTEGRVAVEQSPPSIPASRAAVGSQPKGNALGLVSAGNRVVVRLDATQPAVAEIAPLPAPEMNRRLAWRAPKLELSNTPLVEVIEQINRSSGPKPSIRLVLGDPSLADVRLSGVLRADNVFTLVDLLETGYGLTAERRGPSEIVLRKSR